jgi:hypothetical protein
MLLWRHYLNLFHLRKPMSLNTKTTFFLALSMTCSSLSAAGLFPRGCEVSGFGFQDPFVTLNDGGAQTLFLIQNHATTPIELKRIETHEAFMSPKLQTKIGVAQWAAFASDISNTHFQCSVQDEQGVSVRINCHDALDICQYPRVKFALSNMGSYWVSTNKPQAQVIQEATAKGIYLKW